MDATPINGPHVISAPEARISCGSFLSNHNQLPGWLSLLFFFLLAQPITITNSNAIIFHDLRSFRSLFVLWPKNSKNNTLHPIFSTFPQAAHAPPQGVHAPPHVAHAPPQACPGFGRPPYPRRRLARSQRASISIMPKDFPSFRFRMLQYPKSSSLARSTSPPPGCKASSSSSTSAGINRPGWGSFLAGRRLRPVLRALDAGALDDAAPPC